jgi:cobalt/nickel transport system ATP-binding protein
MADGNVVGSGTPRAVFYDDDLLARANLHPPAAVRIARDAGLEASTRPVTEAELVGVLSDREVPSETIRAESLDGSSGD